MRVTPTAIKTGAVSVSAMLTNQMKIERFLIKIERKRKIKKHLSPKKIKKTKKKCKSF